jgi:hypothetical protein
MYYIYSIFENKLIIIFLKKFIYFFIFKNKFRCKPNFLNKIKSFSTIIFIHLVSMCKLFPVFIMEMNLFCSKLNMNNLIWFSRSLVDLNTFNKILNLALWQCSNIQIWWQTFLMVSTKIYHTFSCPLQIKIS